MSNANEPFMIDGLTKGMPADQPAIPISDVGNQGWNLLRGDLPVPSAVLLESALKHNSRWMQQYVNNSGILFAPHGKTTMCPALFKMQIDDGAWGITAATVQQVRVYRAHGIKRIVLANQLIHPVDIRYIAAEINADPEFEFFCLVDSVRGCEMLNRGLSDSGISRPLQVLLEVGLEGRRTGCRDKESALEIARAIDRCQPPMMLSGVEGFEGMVLSLSNHEEMEHKAIEFLNLVVEITDDLIQSGLLRASPVTLSAGGSSHFDLVVDRFSRADLGVETQIILRSGCYITHDFGMYRYFQQRMYERESDLIELGEGLRPALEVWAMVQSRPDANRAICAIGKRDIGTDVTLPTLEKWYRPGHHTNPQTDGLAGEAVELNDQHCHLSIPEDSPLQVGDLVCMGASHPCTTFDKWRVLLLADDDYNIVSAMETYF
jgi:D-serine dehydratase